MSLNGTVSLTNNLSVFQSCPLITSTAVRKARAQGNDLARERDKLTQQLDTTRIDLENARKEMTSVRNSVIQEKQSLEQRLDEERRAKERARAQLDSRMEELQKRKSKFACL